MIVGDLRYAARDGLQTCYKVELEISDVIQEIVGDLRHGTRVSQGLQTWYRRWLETSKIVQGLVRDFR